MRTGLLLAPLLVCLNACTSVRLGEIRTPEAPDPGQRPFP